LQHVAGSTYVAFIAVAVVTYVIVAAVKWALLIGSCLSVGV